MKNSIAFLNSMMYIILLVYSCSPMKGKYCKEQQNRIECLELKKFNTFEYTYSDKWNNDYKALGKYKLDAENITLFYRIPPKKQNTQVKIIKTRFPLKNDSLILDSLNFIEFEFFDKNTLEEIRPVNVTFKTKFGFDLISQIKKEQKSLKISLEPVQKFRLGIDKKQESA